MSRDSAYIVTSVPKLKGGKPKRDQALSRDAKGTITQAAFNQKAFGQLFKKKG